MSFREKSAWISFLSILLVFGIYFSGIGMAMAGRVEYSDVVRLFFKLVGLFIVLEIVLHAIVAVRAPREARREDERERLIGLKADRVAAYVLSIGALVGIFPIHLGANVRDLAHAVLLAIVIAHLAKYATAIVLHRRDA
jgi:hypothetical protein